MRPRLLDLFCGAGGCSVGYDRAGFDVVGVDIKPQPHYPFEFHQADALEYPLDGFDAIHASPPCQRYCAPTQYNGNRDSYPDLVALIRERLKGTTAVWAIENVPGAPLRDPVILCGTMFGQRFYRHRLFESNIDLGVPNHGRHIARCSRNGVVPPPDGFFTITGGKHSRAWFEAAREAMDVPWMETIRELCESIPPVYTLHVGQHLRMGRPSRPSLQEYDAIKDLPGYGAVAARLWLARRLAANGGAA